MSRGARVLACAALLAPAPARSLAAQAPAAPRALRYDLRPGDHLVYRQWLERRLRSSRFESQSETEWENHVLVLDGDDGAVRVAFQRNRTRAELTRYRENGRDRLEPARRELAEALARRAVAFAEANWLTAQGGALLPWSAVREATSERLPFFHGLQPLPAQAVAPGAAFTSPGPLGMKMRATRLETVAGEECLRLEGALEGALTVRQWHCPGSGTLGRLELEASYGAPGGVDVAERLRLERVSLSRGEAIGAWLKEPKTSQGVLAALVSSDRVSVGRDALDAVLDGDDPEAQRLALAVAWRHRLAPPPFAALRRLAGGPSPRVRTLAVRLLGLRPEPDARALQQAALRDPDPFVQAAAHPRPAPATEVVTLARAVRGDGPLPSWAGPLEPGFGRRALAAQRAAGEVAGATLRFVRAERFRGWPYVLHVPEDYRGDEPYPLVVVLGGGPGRALPTAQTARATVEPRGELVVYPQANGMWWEGNAGPMFDALLRELLGELNVDTDRVTITGFSNGGTGSILYAAQRPDRFAALASLMGGGLPFFEGGLDPIDAAAVARLPMLFVHGTRDEVIPAEASERTVAAVRKVNPGATVELHLLKGRPHDVRYGTDEELALPFLARFTRDPFPRAVSLRARRLGHARAFWVEVAEKGGGTAEVDGTVEGQAIALRTRNVKALRLLLRRELVDLAAPLRVRVDGREAFSGALAEDPELFLSSWRASGDPQRAHAAELLLRLP